MIRGQRLDRATGVNGSSETSVVIDIHPTETRIERGRYYAVKRFFYPIAVILTSNTFTDNKLGTSSGWSG